jgi:hypothetical protein
VRRSTGAISGIGGALLAFLAVLPLQPAAQAQTAVKIGYVDLKRVLDEAPQMIESRAKLEREFSSRDGAIKAAEAKLAALKQRYERDSAIMSKDDAEALKREIEATERANKRMVDEARSELATRQAAERTTGRRCRTSSSSMRAARATTSSGKSATVRQPAHRHHRRGARPSQARWPGPADKP